HTNEHYVHYNNAANEKRNGSNRNNYFGNASGKFIHLLVQILNIHYPKIVFIITVEPVLDPHCDSRIFDSRLQAFSSLALTVNLQIVSTEDLEVCGNWNIHVTVDGIAKESATFFLH